MFDSETGAERTQDEHKVSCGAVKLGNTQIHTHTHTHKWMIYKRDKGSN